MTAFIKELRESTYRKFLKLEGLEDCASSREKFEKFSARGIRSVSEVVKEMLERNPDLLSELEEGKH